jgi:hypothetical protein
VSPDNAQAVEIQSLIGLNSNLTVGEHVLHVQTEDLGRTRACIVTHVFSKSGQVVRKVRFDYSKHLAHPNLAHILPRAMQTQHVAVMQRLREEGLEPSPAISQTDLPCVRVEEKTPSPEVPGPSPKPPRVRLMSGVWDRLVEQARAEREKERAATERIALPEDTPAPRVEAPPEEPAPVVEGLEVDPRRRWEAAIAHARRDYDNTPPPDLAVPVSGGGIAQRAYDEAMACLYRDETERALVLLCRAVGHEPWNVTYRARLHRLLSRLGSE